MSPLRNEDPVFHREVGRDYPVIDSAAGAVLRDRSGKSYIDAAGGIFVVNVGHGVDAIADAMAQQAKRVAFAHTAHFTSDAEIALANRLLQLAPPGFTKVWLVTSGSAANETAIKLARHYHLLRGEAERVKVVSRWASYHGSTLGALALTGHTRRREPYLPYLFDSPKIEPPYCYRCPYGATPDSCDILCADALDRLARQIGPRSISAFIAEPVSGGPLGALVAPRDYFPRIREICDRHGCLMIVDEVITGAGRTGKNLGIDHFGVTPDLITLAKGIGGGYVPIGAVLVHDRVHRVFEAAGESFRHGETFTGHAVTAAAGLATLDYIATRNLVERTAEMGAVLGAALHGLSDLPIVGDVRGPGLLWGLELVADKATKAPFPRSLGVSERVAEAAFAEGLVVTAGSGGIDGESGDTITLAPPYVITPSDIDEIVTRLRAALLVVHQELSRHSDFASTQ